MTCGQALGCAPLLGGSAANRWGRCPPRRSCDRSPGSPMGPGPTRWVLKRRPSRWAGVRRGRRSATATSRTDRGSPTRRARRPAGRRNRRGMPERRLASDPEQLQRRPELTPGARATNDSPASGCRMARMCSSGPIASTAHACLASFQAEVFPSVGGAGTAAEWGPRARGGWTRTT